MRRIFVANGNDFIQNLSVEYRRYETGPDSLYFMIARLSARYHWGCRGFHRADPDSLHFIFQHLADSGDGSPCTNSGNEGIDPLELLHDFERGCLTMHFRVGGIIKLLRHEVVGMFLQKLLRPVDRATHPLGIRSENQPGSVC